MNFRILQLVELGAKTVEYKRSKQGGKLAMRDVALQLGFPTFLVQLRHEIVHEGHQMNFEILEVAMKRLQGFIYQTFWSPLFNQLRKREEQIQVLKQQMYVFKLSGNPPPVQKLSKEEKQGVLSKFTKANIKLTLGLDPSQLIHLVHYFLYCTLNQVEISFKDFKSLVAVMKTFSIASDIKNKNKFDL